MPPNIRYIPSELPDGLTTHTPREHESVDRPLPDGNVSVSLMPPLTGYLREKFHRICSEEQWFVGVRPRISGPEALDLNAFLILMPPRDRFFADPFLIEHAGRNYLFLEEWIFAKGKGVISCVEFDDQGFIGLPSLALEAEHHLSYPGVFEWQGETYMLPETRDSGRIILYRAVEFPERWEYFTTLLSDVWAVDPTMFEHDGMFWMFAGGVTKNGKINSELFLYYSNSPLGPWLPHPKNPVVADVSRARPAGQIFIHEGELIRPGQDCSLSYGGSIMLNRIDKLSVTDYRETPVKLLGPGWFPGGRGTHTLNHSEHYQAIDARILIPQPQLIVSKLKKSLQTRILKHRY